MYYDLIFVDERYSGTTYEIEENIVVVEGVKNKKMTFLFQRDSYEFVYSYHLFEFRGLICRHAISILIRKVKSLLDRYILRR